MNEVVTETSPAQCEIVQETEHCQDDRTECQQHGKSPTAPRDALFSRVSRKARTDVTLLKTLLTLEKHRTTLENIKESITTAFHFVCASLRSKVLLFASSIRIIYRVECRDHAGQDSRLRVVVMIHVENTLDVERRNSS